jgi:Ca2+-transporting ATPase
MEALVSRDFLYSIGLYAALIAAPVLAAIVWQTATGVDHGRAMTMNFAILGLAQLFHLGNARDEGPVLAWRRVIANKAALAALVCGGVSIVAVIETSALAHLLRLVPLWGADWLIVCGLSLVPAIVGQGVKLTQQWQRGGGASG